MVWPIAMDSILRALILLKTSAQASYLLTYLEERSTGKGTRGLEGTCTIVIAYSENSVQMTASLAVRLYKIQWGDWKRGSGKRESVKHAGGGKRGSGNRGTIMQGWKTREKPVWKATLWRHKTSVARTQVFMLYTWCFLSINIQLNVMSVASNLR